MNATPEVVRISDTGNDYGDYLRVCDETEETIGDGDVSGAVAPSGDESVQHNCVIPYYLLDENSSSYAIIIYGKIYPVLIACTIVTNCLVCVVLLKKTMRNPTNTLLVAMAISDILTSVIPAPCFIVFYSLGHCHDWVPYDWCLPYIFLTDHLPTVFHTASVWLTVALAIERYFYVCHSTLAKRICTIRNAVKTVISVYVVAIATQIPRLTELQFNQVRVRSLASPYEMMTGCYWDFIPLVKDNEHLYFNLYYWFRILFTHLFPCVLLVTFNAILGRSMKLAQLRRQQLIRMNRSNECRCLRDNIAATLMLVIVVGLSLIVELPLACFFALLTVENTWEIKLMKDGTASIATLFINLLILFSYPFNFFIYCGMSTQFRVTFQTLFTLSSSHEQMVNLPHVNTIDQELQRNASSSECDSEAARQRRTPESISIL